MESLSSLFFGSPPLQDHLKTHKPFTPKPISPLPKPLPTSVSPKSQIPHFSFTLNSHQSLTKPHSESPSLFQTLAKTITSTALYALPCFASESVVSSAEQVSSDRINLEAVVVSIDDFFRRYPFFVAGCTFVWLVVTPIAQYYLSKCKYIYCIDAFKKLQDDPDAQLLDIRGGKTLQSLKSPNLKLLNKNVVQIQYSENDTDGFVKKVLASFSDPGNTAVCVLDDLDGNSMKVAELLFKNGFKEAYAIKGGVAGKKGWLEIQENLLPPSVHILTKKKTKKSEELEEKNGGVAEANKGDTADSDHTKPTLDARKTSSRSSSPYPNYPDLKPPASPTPSKPSK